MGDEGEEFGFGGMREGGGWRWGCGKGEGGVFGVGWMGARHTGFPVANFFSVPTMAPLR